MEEYQAKSAIIGKSGPASEEDHYPIFVNLFEKNDPHKDPEALPIKFLEYKNVDRIKIEGLDVNYLLTGSDIVINNLTSIKIEGTGPLVTISGKQEK